MKTAILPITTTARTRTITIVNLKIAASEECRSINRRQRHEFHVVVIAAGAVVNSNYETTR